MTGRAAAPAAIAAVVLLVAAVLYFGLSSAFAGTQHHAYDGGRPPSSVALTAGRTYQLSVRGGRTALADRGAAVDQPRCSWFAGTGAGQPLTVTVLPADARSVNVVGTFGAPTAGRGHVECADWGDVYVDDADNSGFDRAGLFIVLGTIVLTVGAILGLAVLYQRGTKSSVSG